MRYRRANGMASGATIATAYPAPIAQSTAASTKKIHGTSAALPRTSRIDQPTIRSTVPLPAARANR